MLTVKPAKDFRAFFGTSLQGYIDADYKVLRKVFGRPDPNAHDNYKSDVEWDVVFSDGSIATIYNYKDGKNYCGASGTAKTKIRDWHVGGRSARALRNVELVLEAYYAKQDAKAFVGTNV
jgi:hypothetical protein